MKGVKRVYPERLKPIDRPPIQYNDGEVVKKIEAKHGFNWQKIICEAIKPEVLDPSQVGQFLIDLVDGNRKLQNDADAEYYGGKLEQVRAEVLKEVGEWLDEDCALCDGVSHYRRVHINVLEALKSGTMPEDR